MIAFISIYIHLWTTGSSLFLPNPTSRRWLKPVGGMLGPDTASLPTVLGRNNSNVAEIICGWRQLCQYCAQLSSRFRLDSETARN
jgi:hypothetical protein